jgi:hypothetical protein
MAKKKNWISGAIKNPGSLTRKAKAAGKSLSEFMKSPGKNVSTQTKRQINLAKTLKKFHQ